MTVLVHLLVELIQLWQPRGYTLAEPSVLLIFIFMQFSGKIGQNNSVLPLGKSCIHQWYTRFYRKVEAQKKKKGYQFGSKVWYKRDFFQSVMILNQSKCQGIDPCLWMIMNVIYSKHSTGSSCNFFNLCFLIFHVCPSPIITKTFLWREPQPQGDVNSGQYFTTRAWS